MLSKKLDVDQIIRNNPRISVDIVARLDALMKRLHRLGIQATEYRLRSPFCSARKRSSMRRADDARRT
jgi:hypothetical protein